MALFDEEPRPKPAGVTVGEDLSRLSEDELRHRIDVLRGEIDRVTEALAAKEASRKAASAFFKS